MRGTTVFAAGQRVRVIISIHVPRAGYDLYHRDSGSWANFISIHVPRAGYDHAAQRLIEGGETFLSTYPVRGTTSRPCSRARTRCISIHVPRAGYDASRTVSESTETVFLSTYPVRGTTTSHLSTPLTCQFLSTYPVRGTTTPDIRRSHKRPISIHVPRAGYDRAV